MKKESYKKLKSIDVFQRVSYSFLKWCTEHRPQLMLAFGITAVYFAYEKSYFELILPKN